MDSERYMLYFRTDADVGKPVFCDSKLDLENKIKALSTLGKVYFKIDKYEDSKTTLELLNSK